MGCWIAIELLDHVSSGSHCYDGYFLGQLSGGKEWKRRLEEYCDENEFRELVEDQGVFNSV